MNTTQLAAAVSIDNLSALMPEIGALPLLHQCHIMHHFVMREIHPHTLQAASSLEEASIIKELTKNCPAYTAWAVKNNTLMSTIDRTVFHATSAEPVTVYYYKANLKSGLTVRIVQGRNVCDCAGVRFTGDLTGPFKAEMIHGNSTGKPKASGARCVLTVTYGIVTPVP